MPKVVEFCDQAGKRTLESGDTLAGTESQVIELSPTPLDGFTPVTFTDVC